ncbi:hypothetical protein FKV24_014185 [Lysobacter maris]|uniref:Uncharacterized protein n=1 Tax=Marilutibacter maris TaxID=1605891 RepID=A0A508A7S0_9GAMM|nr:hypothetical protein [Lysobacter maris]KAB8173388.1 hypothetical protein FKV24_014185 [Lysobacter maris]
MAKQHVIRVLVLAATSMMVCACVGKAQSEFMAGCTSQGAPEARCECVYDKLEAKYGEDGLEAMQKGERILPGFPEATVVAAAQCNGVDPSTALEHLAILGEPIVKANDGSGESVVADGVADPPVQEYEASTQANQVSDESVIENVIAITASAEAGDEHVDARKVALGDLDGDGSSDAAALFIIEVGSQSSSTQYLSAFLRQGDGALKFASMTPVEGAGDTVNGVVVEEGAIRLKTLTLSPDDPDCCPSVEGGIEYLLHGGKLKRVN